MSEEGFVFSFAEEENKTNNPSSSSSSVVVVEPQHPPPPSPPPLSPRSLNRKKYKNNLKNVFKDPYFCWFYTLFTTGTIEELGIYYEDFYEPFIRYNYGKQTFEGLIRDDGRMEDVNVLKFEQIHDREDYSNNVFLPLIIQLWYEVYSLKYTRETLLNIGDFLKDSRLIQNMDSIVKAVKANYVKKDQDYESYLDSRVIDLGYALYHLYKQPKMEWKRIFKELFETSTTTTTSSPPIKKKITKKDVIQYNHDFKSSGIKAYVEGQPLTYVSCVRVQSFGVRPYFGIVVKIDLSNPDEFESDLHEPKLHVVPVMSMTYMNRKQVNEEDESTSEEDDEEQTKKPKKKHRRSENKFYHWISDRGATPFFIGKQNIDIRIVSFFHVKLYEEAKDQIGYLQYYFEFPKKQKSDCKTFAEWKS